MVSPSTTRVTVAVVVGPVGPVGPDGRARRRSTWSSPDVAWPSTWHRRRVAPPNSASASRRR